MEIIGLVLMWTVLVFSVVVHECAHGIAAYKLGDPTAYRAGRLTLNPLKHIDPMMTIIMPVMFLILSGGRFAFGGAKPVPINPWHFRNADKGMMLTGLAGPLSNFTLVLIGILGFKGIELILSPSFALEISQILFFSLILVNLILGIFNLIPIPPLDGSRVLRYFLPWDMKESLDQLERFGLVIVVMLVVTGGTTFISKIINFILQVFNILPPDFFRR